MRRETSTYSVERAWDRAGPSPPHPPPPNPWFCRAGCYPSEKPSWMDCTTPPISHRLGERWGWYCVSDRVCDPHKDQERRVARGIAEVVCHFFFFLLAPWAGARA
ncbi:hypothetical protein IE53DRAFT_34482 [Violaceomyces palustris]|uniref:Uncharacterized protein n=1 Tax=Violaceomyces palustris TaxID=1673888 RepID=A0ACD0P115_9BASI|nr:hypothetical protein IE53DRAFT_34482 [Violaceomyces palustris]